MDELVRMRWENLNEVNFSFDYVKNLLLKKSGIHITEKEFKAFIQNIDKKYPKIDHQEVLFELEDLAYKKIAIFTIRDKEVDEFNDLFRELFVKRNRIERIIDNKVLSKVDDKIYPCFIKFGERYVTIKMAFQKQLNIDQLDSDGTEYTIPKKYFHCAKFVIDIYYNLVFLFYNDIPTWDREKRNGIAITEKKNAFYNLFENGNRGTLNKYAFTSHLNKYVNDFLDNIQANGKDAVNNIISIETLDPKSSRNKLKSTKIDGKHNTRRIEAIRYALTVEKNIVSQIECNINNIWFQFKYTGEIVSMQTFFSKEVLQNVCNEVFPKYKISKDKEICREATD